jgi:hypothetical protein
MYTVSVDELAQKLLCQAPSELSDRLQTINARFIDLKAAILRALDVQSIPLQDKVDKISASEVEKTVQACADLLACRVKVNRPGAADFLATPRGQALAGGTICLDLQYLPDDWDFLEEILGEVNQLFNFKFSDSSKNVQYL